MVRFLAFCCLLSLQASFAWGIVVHNESVDGDLSSDKDSPTPITLSVATGSTEISGTVGTGGTVFDPDFFTITIPAGNQLDEIVLQVYVPTNLERSFFGVEVGSKITSLTSDSAFLGTTLVESASIGEDILANLGTADSGGHGFTGSLGEGTYTFWFQETGGDIEYAFDLRTSPVPEPSAVTTMLIAMLAVLRQRRKV